MNIKRKRRSSGRGKALAEPDGFAVPPMRRRVLLSAAIIIAVGVAVYFNSFAGAFVFDDMSGIVGNEQIRRLWPPWQVVASPPKETVSGRPVVSITLAVNYALGGLEVWGYHAFNLAVHLLAALALFGIVRRTLWCSRLRDRFGRASTALAAAAALIWMVHPLQTQSVTYIIQRAESLMGLFYLLTLYCVIRGLSFPEGTASQPRRRWWFAAAVVSCALGMATKEVMATAPLMVLLYDRVFAAGSFKQIFRRRWGLYAGLAATWVILAALTFSAPRGDTAGFGMAFVGPWGYARTQFHVIVHYLRLSFWPAPLCLDYRDWPLAGSVADVLPWAAVVAALVAATLLALWRNPPLGFLGAWFFVILSPTSSIVPISDLAFEHRMYLSLAAVVVLCVAGGYVLGGYLLRRFSASQDVRRRLGRILGAGLIVVIVGILGYLTVRRNHDYRSPLAMWSDVWRKRPANPRAHANLGIALTLDGRLDEAVEHYTEAVRLKPDFVRAHSGLASTLARMGRNKEAADRYRIVLRNRPDSTQAANNLAWLLATCPDDGVRNGAEAVVLAERACRATNYEDAGSLDTLAAAYAEAGRFDQAVATAGRAVRAASKAKKSKIARQFQARLKLYQARRPFRQQPTTRQAKPKAVGPENPTPPGP